MHHKITFYKLLLCNVIVENFKFVCVIFGLNYDFYIGKK